MIEPWIWAVGAVVVGLLSGVVGAALVRLAADDETARDAAGIGAVDELAQPPAAVAGAQIRSVTAPGLLSVEIFVLEFNIFGAFRILARFEVDVADILTMRNRSEALQCLYVAVTRPKTYLILVV